MIRSLLKSSTFSTLASLLSYGLTILLARNEAQLAFAEFTYAIAWSLILIQIIDLAATHCLTHFRFSTKECIVTILASLYVAKTATLLLVLGGMWLFGAIIGADVPYAALFFLVPAFYLGPVFEMRSLNVQFARILFLEKGSLLVFCYLYLLYNPLDYGVYAGYFVISLLSLGYQIPAFAESDPGSSAHMPQPIGRSS